MTTLELSSLGKTWLVDIDGVLLRHNGHLNGGDEWLPGAQEFLSKIPKGDVVVLMTARKEAHAAATREFLQTAGVRFDHLLFNCALGERILINDRKPSGLAMAHAVNLGRDEGPGNIQVRIDPQL